MNKINEITKRLSEISLTISRVPPNTKRDFINLANAEFIGDYGLTLHFILQQAMEYQAIKPLFFDKLQNMEDKIDNLTEQKEDKPKQVVKTCSGRIIK